MMDYEVFEIPVDMNRLPLEVTRAIEHNDSRGYKLADIQRNSYEVPDGSETVSEVWKLVFESHGMIGITSIRYSSLIDFGGVQCYEHSQENTVYMTVPELQRTLTAVEKSEGEVKTA